ncbi:hypothetical protein QJS10_CPA09g01187 [Acorus calamus]|uniref:Uncharacterized protein n=1 Tax=Acorus calamus TaxID=4465 RepID=A0AAV9E3L0_ACOCL|nr:hypothetical protein QJS10_CPA09g01187 [Acorus calamus]
MVRAWSIPPFGWRVRGCQQSYLFVYVLVIVHVAPMILFGLDLDSHRTVIMYSGL